ncbi:hypothetical protein SS50377_22344 [Spironucleus salmonicida]|uniref:Leucine-rich repeat containing protein n=1 Tax=Spironucleus salmonicida TaxID=348837 RepID=V6LER4_9EUKA|nr:hypothetical protein SS50377_22344 [Spironucleus salmonicida]|eukprot:EST42161.1 hypothetical protein SS50377_18469 [Spironucleus salmonicida]
MPPKADNSKAKKKTPEPEYRDDKGNPIPFEDYIQLLKRKYMAFCKNANVNGYNILLEKIKNSIDSDDKTLVGVPFTTLTIGGNVTPAQIPPTMAFIELYNKLTRVSFSGVCLTDEAMQSIGKCISITKTIRYMQFIDCKISANGMKEFFNTVPLSGLQSFSIEGNEMSSESIIGLGLMVEKYIQMCRQTAQAAIEEAAAKHQEELEKIERENAAKKSKKKPKVWKAKKGEIIIFDKTVDDIFYSYFNLRSISMISCGLNPLHAPAIGVFVEKVAPFLSQIIFRNQEFGAIGIGEVGSGLLRASQKLSQQMKTKADQQHPNERETYTGNQLLLLEEMEFKQCCIQEDQRNAYARFNEGILQCGRLKTIVLTDNVLEEQINWIIPCLIMQKSLIKAVLPEKCNSLMVKDLSVKLREHRKAQDDWTKLAKKMAKEAKKAAKLAKKNKVPVQPVVAEAPSESTGSKPATATVE